MFKSTSALGQTIRSSVLIQLTLILSAALVAYLLKGSNFSVALIFGGFISVAGTLVHAWRLHLATERVDGKLSINSAEIIKGSVLKYIVVVLLLALGMGNLQLEPIAMVIGFGIAQMNFLFTRGYAPRRVSGHRG